MRASSRRRIRSSWLLENADLVKAVDRVSTLSSEKGRAVKLDASEGSVVVSASNPDSGSATEEISADYKHEPIEIGFNARYLLDIAGQIDGAKALFKLADGSSPTLISDESDPRRAVRADAHAGLVAAGRWRNELGSLPSSCPSPPGRRDA